MKVVSGQNLVRAAVMGALVTVACTATVNAVAMYTGSRNHVSIGREVALPGVVLQRGTYTFEETRLHGSMHIVRVTSRDRSRVLYTGFAWRITRPADLPAGQSIALAEAPAGEPRPITAWFPIGEAHGNKFVR